MDATEYLETRLTCSCEGRPECLEAAEKLRALSWLARKEGLLALVGAAEQELDAFLKAAVETMMDALWDEKLLTARLNALLAERGAHGGNAQKNRLIVQGLLCIHDNVRPDALAEQMENWLGMDGDNEKEAATQWRR